MTVVSLDFETRSVVDLKRAGVYVYAEHPQTDVQCLAWAIDDDEPELWWPGDPLPLKLKLAIDREYEMRAWNAQFERLIWRSIMVPRYKFPKIPMERWFCTMADAGAMALPRSLESCAAVLRVAQQKDMAAWRLGLRLARPRFVKDGVVTWWTREKDPERFVVLGKYCQQDVRTERAIAKVTRRLDANERRVYLLDQQINDRGLNVDLDLVHALRRITETGLERANEEIRRATNGEVVSVTDLNKMKAWLTAQGYTVPSLDKTALRELLAGEHPDPVRDVLEARAEAGRSSTAKIDALLRCLCSDGRVRGTMLYHGANTGRWAGRLLQTHNFPRPQMPRPETFIPDVLKQRYDAIDLFYPPLMVVAALLRGMLVASAGHRLLVGDFAGIEARVLNWLAGQHDIIEAFRRKEKIYERMAAAIFGVPAAEISKEDPRRQIGKNTELGCGYGLGWKTYQRTVWEQEGVALPDVLCQKAVEVYRSTHPAVVEFWRDLESAALNAVEQPGSMHAVAGNKFVVRGGYLWLVLRSGRPLAYARPRIEDKPTPWGELKPCVTAENVNSQTRQWQRRPYYGGLWAENIVQAVSRDLMAGAMLRATKRLYPIVLTVHDEIVADVPVGHGSLDEFLNLMAHVPLWADGCPIDVEGWEGERYRK